MPDMKEKSLADFAAASGVEVGCSANLPLEMDDPRFVWFIEQGAVDVFMVDLPKGKERSAPQHIMRLKEGNLLPGVAPQSGETTLGLTAKGLPGTVLRRMPSMSLAAVRSAEIAAQIDAWVAGLAIKLARDVPYRPRIDAFIETGQPFHMEDGKISVLRGVAWVSMSVPESALFLDLVDIEANDQLDGAGAIPVTPACWVTLPEPQQVSAESSESLWNRGLLLRALEGFHRTAFTLERINRTLEIADQKNLDHASTLSRRIDKDRARSRLFNPYGLPEAGRDAETGTALAEVLRRIGRHEGINFKWPAKSDQPDFVPALQDILDVSGVRARRIRLDEQRNWWIGDCGAMLAFRGDDGRPVALLPGALGRYRMFDPASGKASRVTSRDAASLKLEGWYFYCPLTSASAGFRDLFQIAGKGLLPSVARFAVAGLLGGLIMLLPAALFGYIANRVIPDQDFGLLISLTGALGVVGFVWALMRIFQGMALIRVEGRAASRVESAFWDRLLRLPPRFLHQFPTGDLAMRGMTFQRIRNAVQGRVGNDVLSIVFLFPALVSIAVFDAVLGGLAAALGLLSLLVTLLLGLRQAPPRGRIIRAIHRLTGRLFQIIDGISKLRVAGAERSAFAAWARDFGEQQRAELDFCAREAHMRAFGAALPLLSGAVLLLATTLRGPGALSVGEFLFIYVALMIFISGVVRLGASFATMAAIVPEYAQVRPFLAASPETSFGVEPVEYLGGDIVFDRVTFSYEPDGPLILDDVSIHVRPGEFIAIAGESGSGKSTLFRLALGLNQPTAGAIYYDGRDMRQLNAKQLRRKIGVVPQEVRMHPQDIWDNIVGNNIDANAEAVWDAARAAAVENELLAMPMGLLTCVGDSGSVTSGGESQRIMIASALVRNPRVLLLDEATNWLDNNSQAKIMDGLGKMSSTRIVIAHRLSTLRQADRIYVLDAGQVVQNGTFAELAATDGVFRDLVRRQET